MTLSQVEIQQRASQRVERAFSADVLPPDATLEDLLKPTPTPNRDGTVLVGALQFTAKEYAQFCTAQRVVSLGLSATEARTQLQVLWDVEHGRIPGSEPRVAPPGTTLTDLLQHDLPDAQGFVHFGSLRVPAGDVNTFVGAETDLIQRDPEALAVLHGLVHSDRTFTMNINDVGNDTFDPGSNTISWDPAKMARDQYNGAVLPPVSNLLHEQSHALGDPLTVNVLQNIPSSAYSNYEEKRVICGPELRFMGREKLKPRESHFGAEYETQTIDSTIPILHVNENGKDLTVSDGFSASGTLRGISNGEVELATGSGSMRFKVNEFVGFLGDGMVDQTVARLHDAVVNQDQVSISITADGRIGFSDPAQEQRTGVTVLMPNPSEERSR